MTSQPDEAAVLAAVRSGDATAFAAAAERYRPQLLVHCYRMLGSVDDAEDLVQETFLRAWRARSGFEGRSLFRTWLYRIATNACLNALERTSRRVLPQDVAPPVTLASDWSNPPSEPPWMPEVPWLEPISDRLLDVAAPPEAEPEVALIARETIELAYLAALQHLPPRQRAVLILNDVLDWSAKETAALLDTSVQSVNSALQRARGTMRAVLPSRQRDVGAPAAAVSEDERAVLQRFVDAWEQADAPALVAMMREQVRWVMPPAPLWFDGRATIAKLFATFPIQLQGEIRMLQTSANRQPAAATYIRRPGESTYQLVSLNVLRIEDDQISEITSFSLGMLRRLDLPATLSDR
jgi:RNA polymerase sigma-70 factor (ECF subfamily)